MKRFFVKAVLFAAPLLVAFVVIEIDLRGMSTSYRTKQRQFDATAGEVELLVVGPSHTEQGIYPALLSQKGYNLAFGGQDLYYDRRLVERALSRAPRLHLVILTVSYISLEYRMYDAIEPWRTHFYSLFFHIPNESWRLRLQLEDMSALALFGPEKAIEYGRGGFKADLSGGDLNPDGSRRVSAHLAARDAEANGAQRFALDRRDIMHAAHFQENVAELDALLGELERRNIRAVIVTLPVLPGYARPARASDSWGRMQEAIAALRAGHHVDYFDYFEDPRFNVADFANADHLNDQGAVKLSRIVDDEIVSAHRDKSLDGK